MLKSHEKKLALRIQKIYLLKNGNLLIGTLSQSVKIFDIKNKTSRDISSENPDKTGIFAREFIQFTENEYWIGTETGVYIYNDRNHITLRLHKEYDNPYCVSDNVITTFCKDREDGLWTGSYFGGMNYYPKQFTNFEKYFPEYHKPSISGNVIHEICKDQQGNLWVRTEDGGLNKMDLIKKTFTSFSAHGGKNEYCLS